MTYIIDMLVYLIGVQIPHGPPRLVNCDMRVSIGAGVGVGYGNVAKGPACNFVGGPGLPAIRDPKGRGNHKNNRAGRDAYIGWCERTPEHDGHRACILPIVVVASGVHTLYLPVRAG